MKLTEIRNDRNLDSVIDEYLVGELQMNIVMQGYSNQILRASQWTVTKIWTFFWKLISVNNAMPLLLWLFTAAHLKTNKD